MRPDIQKFRIVDCRGKPIEISFEEFVHLRVRDILNMASEYLLEIGSPPIFAATGDKAFKIAMRLNPERTVFFHEIIGDAISFWSADTMDKQLIELPLKGMDCADTSKVIFRIQKLEAAQREAMA